MDTNVSPTSHPPFEPPHAGVLVVLTNAPDAAVADTLARALVDERLAACVNVLSPCRSVYRWQGAVHDATEVPLLIKTATDRLAALQQRLRELHPYDTPEILAWRPDAGWPPYAQWVVDETRPAAPDG